MKTAAKPFAIEKPPRRVLLVDDELALRRTIADRLSAEGYSVELAPNGVVGERMARSRSYDLIILDLTLPLKDGLDVCRDLRRDEIQTPVLILTARDATADKIVGLKTGADDYLTKPFESSELVARIEAVLRRGRLALPEPEEYAFGDVVVRPVGGLVVRNGRPVKMSAQELKLLIYFVRHRGELLSRDQLLDSVWGYQSTPETRTVDVHVSWLRQKLEPDPHQPRYIVTVFGLGYRFQTGDQEKD